MATEKGKKEVERQTGLDLVPGKSNSNSCNDVSSLRGRAAGTSTCEDELLSSASTDSSKIQMATAE